MTLAFGQADPSRITYMLLTWCYHASTPLTWSATRSSANGLSKKQTFLHLGWALMGSRFGRRELKPNKCPCWLLFDASPYGETLCRDKLQQGLGQLIDFHKIQIPKDEEEILDGKTFIILAQDMDLKIIVKQNKEDRNKNESFWENVYSISCHWKTWRTPSPLTTSSITKLQTCHYRGK